MSNNASAGNADGRSPQDDIDAIMNEIEQLQKGMAAVEGAPAPAAPEPAPVIPIAAAPAPAPAAPTPAPAPAAPAAVVAAEVENSAQSLTLDNSSIDEFMKEFQAASGDGPGMEDTLSELKEEDSEVSLLDQTYKHHEAQQAQPKARAVESYTPDPVEAPEAKVEPEPEPELEPEPTPVSVPAHAGRHSGGGSDSAEGSLSMTLTGNMTLKLRYEYEGQEILIGFSDQALKVQLSDGTEFKIPVARKVPVRRAA